MRRRTNLVAFGNGDTKLYTEKNLFKAVDKLLGIQNHHYATIEAQKDQFDFDAEQEEDYSEFAVVAFWDLHETDVFQCTRFFLIMNPQKRIIQDIKGTKIAQVLF